VRRLCVGVDAGATRVRAGAVRVDWERGRPRLELAGELHSEVYPRAEGFEPWPLARQARDPERPDAEVLQAALCLDATARCIREALTAAPTPRGCELRVAVCLPGLRSAEERGIRAALHLPRMPDFVGELEARLRGFAPGLSPIGRVLSDGRARGLGERFGAGGAFAGTSEGYYLGAGTGLAESFLRCGDVLDETRLPAGLLRAWELPAGDGTSFDARISAAGVNRAWSRVDGSGAHPELCADAGDRRARELLGAAGRACAELVRQRLELWPRIAAGPLQRVVLGQRLADWWARASFRVPFDAELANGPAPVHDAVRASELAQAAVLGAVAAMVHPV
jgi:hypothetical protein